MQGNEIGHRVFYTYAHNMVLGILGKSANYATGLTAADIWCYNIINLIKM